MLAQKCSASLANTQAKCSGANRLEAQGPAQIAAAMRLWRKAVPLPATVSHRVCRWLLKTRTFSQEASQSEDGAAPEPEFKGMGNEAGFSKPIS